MHTHVHARSIYYLIQNVPRTRFPASLSHSLSIRTFLKTLGYVTHAQGLRPSERERLCSLGTAAAAVFFFSSSSSGREGRTKKAPACACDLYREIRIAEWHVDRPAARATARLPRLEFELGSVFVYWGYMGRWERERGGECRYSTAVI